MSSIATKIFVAVFLLLTLAVGIVVILEPFKLTNVLLDASKTCEPQFEWNATTTSQWDRDVLTVHVSACENCNRRIEGASAQVLGSFVLLRLMFSTSPPAACNCPHSAVLRLADVPRRDYTVIRLGSPWVQYGAGCV